MIDSDMELTHKLQVPGDCFASGLDTHAQIQAIHF
jgi:hypothetical protein